MKGYYSIKYVFLGLVPELIYDELTIMNDGDACAAFYNLGKTAGDLNFENTRKSFARVL
jgi:hypothetical protein